MGVFSMLKGFGAGTGAAFLLLAGTASAQTPPAAPAPQTIERAQGEEMIKGMFGQIDANHDGVADATEQTAILEALKGAGAPEAALAAVRRILTESVGPDGKVTLATFVKSRMTAFDKADTNHDGKLTPAEQEASRAA